MTTIQVRPIESFLKKTFSEVIDMKDWTKKKGSTEPSMSA